MAGHDRSAVSGKEEPAPTSKLAPLGAEWHQLSAEETLRELRASLDGLSDDEARARLAVHGPNEIAERGAKSPWLILLDQLMELMVLILVVAAVISLIMGDLKDAIVIGAIVVLNTILGFSQEFRAERAMAALKQLAVPVVRVRRAGRMQEVSSRDLVPGDVVLLEAGAVVPADCRIVESANLRVQEAALTGESEPVDKTLEPLSAHDLPVADRTNMVYKGTVVAYGRGAAAVVATGMATELGKIAELIQSVERTQTPLQKRLQQLGKGLAFAALVLVAVVFAMGLARGEDLRLMFMTAMSLAVAAVPEGLPAVVTIALALGSQRMLQRHALIRKLPAVETLGSVTVICSDKTGTLTENRMTVTVLDLAGHRIDLTEEVHRIAGEAFPAATIPDHGLGHGEQPPESSLALLLAGAALCNDSQIEPEARHTGNLHALGDPTEAALVVAAARFGFWKDELEKAMPRVGEVPFDSDRKRMTTVHPLTSECPFLKQIAPATQASESGLGAHVAFVKGAVDGLVSRSTRVWSGDGPEPLTDEWRARIQAGQDELASRGMRVLGIAFRVLPEKPKVLDEEALEADLVFVGLAGMIDPPRPEVHAAVARCKEAGIRPVMITGDHPLTALHIGKELGIAEDGVALTGQDLIQMDPADLDRHTGGVSVYARVSPAHKLDIVRSLQRQGHIVAMTGDGVNDAPALKKADIGVAMGITGTDVSKEAADMVLLDDNFATIVAAVEEGRTIYENIRKFIKYLLTSNSGELWVMLLGAFFGMSLPLMPLQILWINLVTDGLPALTLSFEPPERDVMRRPPVDPKENVFARGMGLHIIWVGLLMAALSLTAGVLYRGQETWQTMVFMTLTLSQMAHVLAIRTGTESLFTAGLMSNYRLTIAVAITLGLQFAVLYVPALSGLFSTTALSARDLGVCFALSSVVFFAVELEKWVARRRGALR